MGIWSNASKKKAPTTSRGRTAEPLQGQGSRWTGGRDLSAKIVTGVLVIGLLCGPVALGWSVFRGAPTAVANASDRNAGLTAAEQSTGSYALGYVAAWLGASKDNTAELQRYVDASKIRNLTDQPWAYRDAAVVSITPTTSTDSTSVVVAANVKEFAASTTDDGSTETWPRRYFQVAVSIAGATGALAVEGLPAPVAAPPAKTTTPELVYTTQLPPTSAAATAVSAFLGAYLAGSGDISRYISPSAEISAIAPAPYAAVEPDDIRVDEVPSEKPADGDQARVLVTATLTNALDQRLTATYAITIRSRADRWEVISIDPAPVAKTSSSSTRVTPAPTPIPSSTGDSTEGK